MGYRYENDAKVVFDNCAKYTEDQPEKRDYSVVVHHTQVPNSYDKGYRFRVVANTDALAGESDGILENRDVVGYTAVPWAMGQVGSDGVVRKSNCTLETCRGWCTYPKAHKVPAQRELFFGQPFDSSKFVYVEHLDGEPPIDLSNGMTVKEYERQVAIKNSGKIAIAKPSLMVGKFQPEPIRCQYSKTVPNLITIDWTFQTPQFGEYPACAAKPGNTIVFTYYRWLHSVGSISPSDYPNCPGFTSARRTRIRKILLIRPTARCKYPQITYAFMYTESDHCTFRGMRIKIVVGNGKSFVSNRLPEKMPRDTAPTQQVRGSNPEACSFFFLFFSVLYLIGDIRYTITRDCGPERGRHRYQ